jgi:glycine C-acetyltransferase
LTDAYFSQALADLEQDGLLRKPKVFSDCDGRTVTCDEKKYLLFCSNDYLGLSHDPRIKTAAIEGVGRYGFGSGGSRLVSGTRGPHVELENAIKDYLKAPAAILFNSGYSANTGIIPAIAGKGDAIIADRLNHASIVDGCRLSRAEFHRYPHKDMAALEKLLAKSSSALNRWVITDGLFSMDGDTAPLDAICGLAKKYDARVYVDDAHGFGVLGENGRGCASLYGVEGQIDLLVGTLGKAAGGMGAFAVGGKSAIDYILNKARSFIFSTAMPPATAYGNLKAVEMLAGFDDGRREFLGITESFHSALKTADLASRQETYIIPILLGDAKKAVLAANMLWGQGIFIQAVRPPAVPEGSARLRLTLSLSQTSEDRRNVARAVNELNSAQVGV